MLLPFSNSSSGISQATGDSRYVNKSGDTMSGQLSFSGTTHPGVKLNSLTTTQRDALTPNNGILLYNSTTNQVQKYENSQWVDVSKSPGTKVIAPAGLGYGADYYTTGTNDNVAIQAAITALPANGGLIFLREGSYTIGAPLLLNKSNISLIGVGWGTKLTLANGVNDHMIKVTGTGTKKIVVKSLQLQGNSANQTAFSSDGINVDTPWQDPGPDPDHLFEDLDIFDFANNGFTVQPHDTRILNCNRVKTRLNRGWGFYIEGTDESYTNCIADEGMQGGFYCGNYDLRFINCFAFFCGQNNTSGAGFYLHHTNNYFTSCEAQANYYDGFTIASGANNNSLVNCIADSNGQTDSTGVGLRIASNNNTITGGESVYFSFFTGWTQAKGISLEGTATGNRVLNMYLSGNIANYSDTSSGTNYHPGVNDTAGGVIFTNGTGLTQNNSKLFWDNTNNRLGVGTASPAADLHISTANSTNIEVDSSNTGSTGIVLNNTSTGGKNLSFFSTGSANGFGAGQFGVYNNTDNKSIMLAYGATGNFRYLQGANLGWGDAQFALSADTGIARNGAGIVEVNNGTNGTYRDLQIRSLLQSGKMSAYNNITTVSNGIPSELATIDSTGLTANVNAATLYAVPASGEGMYRISAYVVETTAGSISSTLPNVQITYTDKDSNTSITIDATPVLGVAGIGQTGALTANTVGTASSGVIVIYVKASTTIQYLTTNYASNLAGMTYALRLKLESL